jgi:insertion element IS1 protein InsB
MTPRHQPISKETRDLIYRLLLEKISLAGILRSTGVSDSQAWRSHTVATILCQSKISSSQKRSTSQVKKKGKLTIKCDEMWSFLGFKGNKQWIWLAIDVVTKEIVGVYIGKRDETGTEGLWDSLQAVPESRCLFFHRLLERLSESISKKETPISSQRNWQNFLYRKI